MCVVLCAVLCVCCMTHSHSVTVSTLGTMERYEVEQELEFTSERKRMSIIARSLDSGA